MDLLKRILKKASEVLSLLLIFGFIYKFFSSKPSSISDINEKLDDVSEPFEQDIEDSNEQYRSEIEEIEDEKKVIDKLSNADLASEFDSEF